MVLGVEVVYLASGLASTGVRKPRSYSRVHGGRDQTELGVWMVLVGSRNWRRG